MAALDRDQLSRLTKELASDYAAAFRECVDLHCQGWPEDDAELNALEGVRQAFRLANAGHLMHLEGDPAYPLLIKIQSLQRQMQLPAADAVYHWTRLSGEHVYHLRGHRGSAHLFQIAVYEGSCSRYPDFRIFSMRDSFEDEALAAGTELDVTLSRERREGTWLELPEGECELYVRQYYYDWGTEEPALLRIEREGAVYPPAELDREDFADRVGRVNSWLRVQSDVLRKAVRASLDCDPALIPATEIPGAFEGTRYLNGHYRCPPGQAVIMELEEPRARYWGFQLSNLQWEALDYCVRRTSINGHQAAIDDDGMFRAVISHEDPGVANWLDAGGRTLGLVAGRYFKPQTVPTPRLKVVPFASVADHLPRGTRRVTPEERQQELRARLESVYRRLCGDQ